MKSIAGSTKRFIVCCIQFVALTSLVGNAWGLDLDQTVDFNIPKQKLDSALVQFSEQAKIQITSSSDQVKDFSTDGIVGRFRVSTALKTLLQHSGLSFKPVGQSAISIGKFAADSAASSSTGGGGKQSSQDFRVAQLDQTNVGPQVDNDQNSEKKKQEGLSEIVVTGTHIHGAETTSPVESYGREAIEDSG